MSKVTGKVVYFDNSKYGGSSLKLDNTEFLSSRDEISGAPEAIAKGDVVEVEMDTVSKNGKTYYNYTISSLKKVTGSNYTPATKAPATGGGNNDIQQSIHSGQMFNLAVAIAIHKGDVTSMAIAAEFKRLGKLKNDLDNPAAETAAPVAQENAVDAALADVDFGEAV